MNRLMGLPVLLAIALCGTIGLASTPASAKKNTAGEAHTVQKQSKQARAKRGSSTRAAAKDCRRAPVPPFMRNPRYMNRGFFRNRC